MAESIATPAPAVSAPKLLTPRQWALAKVDELAAKHKVHRTAVRHLLAGAYVHGKWERDPHGNDLSLVTEADFEAAIAAVAGVSLSSNPTKEQ
jgi:hypothetical protein